MFPLLKRIVLVLRNCFPGDNSQAYKSALSALKALSDCCCEDLNEHLDLILSKMSHKINDKLLRPEIVETLAAMEHNGGEPARTKIKAKVPSYN